MIFENVTCIFFILNRLFWPSPDPIREKTGIPSTYAEVQAYQIVITEIMADPFPEVGLPGYEYIELFNRSAENVCLENWMLCIGKHEHTLPSVILAPGSYLLVCAPDGGALLGEYGETVLVNNMSPILNSGQSIVLKDTTGEIIHSVTFSDRWYRDADKAQGGWSLEMIDPDNPCGGFANWNHSADPRGGTPGTKNSVNSYNPDIQPPLLLRATMPTDSSLLLHFSESMDYYSLNNPGYYSVNSGVLHPATVKPVSPHYQQTVITYHNPFKRGLTYTITLLPHMKDCVGNPLTTYTYANFAIAQEPENSDIVFNEILFNPVDNTAEFIELYNRSSKVIDLTTFSLALANYQTGTIRKTTSFNDFPYIIFPQNYALITNNASALPQDCYHKNPRVVIEIPGLFTLPNEEALLVLMDSELHVIDECHYNSYMHSPILRDVKGVSLERINPDSPSQDPDNWLSASSSSGYSTPGLQNSQMTISERTYEITVKPDVFSPDNDGIDDLMTLHLVGDTPGWIATITIYDMHGHLVKTLANHYLLGIEENIVWDGLNNDSQPVDVGIYLIYGELFNTSGNSKKFKKVIPLVRRLNR